MRDRRAHFADMTPDEAAQQKLPVLAVAVNGTTLTRAGGVAVPTLPEEHRFTAGLAYRDGVLYVANLDNDSVYRCAGVGFADQRSATVGYRPVALALSPDGSTLAVANWGGASVTLLDSLTLESKATVAVGDHPAALAYAPDGRLFVADAGSNTVSVIAGTRVSETIVTSNIPARRRGTVFTATPVGTTPLALALDPTRMRLFVANADENDVAMIDVAHPGAARILAFIPTAWYPSALALAPDGKTLYVGTAKGVGFGANVPPKNAAIARREPTPSTPYSYIADMLAGHVAVVDVPEDGPVQVGYSAIARFDTDTRADPVSDAEAADIQKNVFSKIKHVLYIIRENRTYDQVFGDLGRGNGDPALTLFGADVTPNAHAIAKRWVTLDEFMASGEVSEDGHQWTDAAYATDFTQKAWTNSYSGRGEPQADARLISLPAGYLWDAAARAGLTYQSYGEFALFTSTPSSPPLRRAIGTLEGHYSKPWAALSGKKPYPRDTELVPFFTSDLAAAANGDDLPQLTIMWLPEDHTEGLKAGALTPTAHVASNDLALGTVLDRLSHSRFWPTTAVFVTEDDAQNGPDHVDAHRTISLVASPYAKRGAVDSTPYQTVSMVRTIELILGLPPMTRFDRDATPMYRSFTTNPDFAPYGVENERVDLGAINPATGDGAKASAKLDLSAPDRADPDVLNAILWHALRPGIRMPAAVHRTDTRDPSDAQ
jgi:YVTN family beta-propeller protein